MTYWNRGKDAYTGSCGGDDGAQRLTVMVTDGELTADGSLVKRDAVGTCGELRMKSSAVRIAGRPA